MPKEKPVVLSLRVPKELGAALSKEAQQKGFISRAQYLTLILMNRDQITINLD